MIDGTRVSDYEYELPPGRIARYPTELRDRSKLLVVPREGGPFEHEGFSDLVDLLNPGDVLVVNESRVSPARLLGRKPTGAPAEILLLRPWSGGDERGSGVGIESGSQGSVSTDEATLWEALVRPGGKLKPGRVVNIAPGFDVEIVDGALGGGRVVRLLVEGSAREALERHGHVPLPPYLERDDEPLDRERYQTVYARVPGSVAAPTAGLHFTPELLYEIEAKGVTRVAVTLDVGVGTFRPVEAEDPAEHDMHSERYFVPAEAAYAINAASDDGRRIWAVGTTVVPTAQMRRSSLRAALIAPAVSAGTKYRSLCISCSAGSSASTGRNVPTPTSRVSATRVTPFASISCNNSGVKCSPAVGAATEPGTRAYTVW